MGKIHKHRIGKLSIYSFIIDESFCTINDEQSKEQTHKMKKTVNLKSN